MHLIYVYYAPIIISIHAYYNDYNSSMFSCFADDIIISFSDVSIAVFVTDSDIIIRVCPRI